MIWDNAVLDWLYAEVGPRQRAADLIAEAERRGAPQSAVALWSGLVADSFTQVDEQLAVDAGNLARAWLAANSGPGEDSPTLVADLPSDPLGATVAAAGDLVGHAATSTGRAVKAAAESAAAATPWWVWAAGAVVAGAWLYSLTRGRA